MRIDGVFEGGGVKGIAFVGAICYLEEHGYKFERVAGTSAGSIISALLAAGYTGEELRKIMMMTNFSKFKQKNILNTIPLLGNILNLVVNKGMYNNSRIESWISDLLKKKGKTKFKHVYRNGEFKLKIIVSDVTKKELIILPDDLSKFGIDPMEFEIAKAVTMSASIPFYFYPYVLKYQNKFSYIVDGGLLSDFPIWIFDVEGIPRWPTFGFELVSNKELRPNRRKGFIPYAMDVITTPIEKNENIYVKDKNSVRVIKIPVFNISATDFNLSRKESLLLFNSGYNSANEFLQKWDFIKYIKKYRMN